MSFPKVCPKYKAEKMPNIAYYKCGSYYGYKNQFYRAVECLEREFEEFKKFMLKEVKNPDINHELCE